MERSGALKTAVRASERKEIRIVQCHLQRAVEEERRASKGAGTGRESKSEG